MYVLSQLIKLPNEGSDLPLPWYQRACLGLISRTPCYVSFVKHPDGKGRPVPDIIVSVLNPMQWNDMLRIQCTRNDAPGVVADTFDAVEGTNIALAESITSDEGSRHFVSLICEVLDPNKRESLPSRIRKRLHDKSFEGITVERYQQRQNVIWHNVGIVERGWVIESKWKSELHRRYGAIAAEHNIDLSKAVVTVDTATRSLRFVFPHKGAKNITIEHADIPGALKAITGTFLNPELNLNLLSAVLRRGGAKPYNAIFFATAEPKNGKVVEDFSECIRKHVEALPTCFRADLEMHNGLDAARLIWARDPDTLVAPCPSHLAHDVLREKKRLPKGKIPIFFSRRFTDSVRADSIAEHIRDIAGKSGCVMLEATPPLGQAPTTIFQEVTAKMWLAEGGIVLVLGSDDRDFDPLGMNLPHEFGYLQGQCKPILLLVEGATSGALRPWSNIHGIHAPHFADAADAFDPHHPRSISKVVSAWFADFKKGRRLN
jgi:hypothetical protein